LELGAVEERSTTEVRVHRHVADAMPVNAYLVETSGGVVAIDSTLTVSDARAVRRRADDLSKPLHAVLITHAHPDHYGGTVELVGSDDIPVIAATGVDEVIRRDDELKEGIIRPMFGDEWPRERRFPNMTLGDGESVEFDGVAFTLMDLGPGESPHDSVWLVGDERQVAFAGDTAYQQMHCFLADGYWESWLANIKRLRAELADSPDVRFGHGDPMPTSPLDWQERYINSFIEAVQEADWSDRDAAKAQVVGRMTDFLPDGELQFLMELSVEPVAAKLGLVPEPTEQR
jgi:glyoxylase-like metal-dependent hydrolase (beta-lactamase superfamily II)